MLHRITWLRPVLISPGKLIIWLKSKKISEMRQIGDFKRKTWEFSTESWLRSQLSDLKLCKSTRNCTKNSKRIIMLETSKLSMDTQQEVLVVWVCLEQIAYWTRAGAVAAFSPTRSSTSNRVPLRFKTALLIQCNQLVLIPRRNMEWTKPSQILGRLITHLQLKGPPTKEWLRLPKTQLSSPTSVVTSKWDMAHWEALLVQGTSAQIRNQSNSRCILVVYLQSPSLSTGNISRELKKTRFQLWSLLAKPNTWRIRSMQTQNCCMIKTVRG